MTATFGSALSSGGGSWTQKGAFSRSSYSFTSADSFVSAQGEVADLEDFADLPIDDSLPSLYVGSMKQLDESGIPCRVLRTELVGCQSDIEYLCKLHCVRLACQGMFHMDGAVQWFTSAGRSLISDLVALADKVNLFNSSSAFCM